jgi:hypothetical protein
MWKAEMNIQVSGLKRVENANILKADATAGKRKHTCFSFVCPQLSITFKKILFL